MYMHITQADEDSAMSGWGKHRCVKLGKRNKTFSSTLITGKHMSAVWDSERWMD
jgi:hypothetical protein